MKWARSNNLYKNFLGLHHQVAKIGEFEFVAGDEFLSVHFCKVTNYTSFVE